MIHAVAFWAWAAIVLLPCQKAGIFILKILRQWSQGWRLRRDFSSRLALFAPECSAMEGQEEGAARRRIASIFAVSKGSELVLFKVTNLCTSNKMKRARFGWRVVSLLKKTGAVLKCSLSTAVPV
jgi:hypothetical protein